jgi:hypothetical protein
VEPGGRRRGRQDQPREEEDRGEGGEEGEAVVGVAGHGARVAREAGRRKVPRDAPRAAPGTG